MRGARAMFGRAGGPCGWSNGGRVRVFQKVLVKCPTSACSPGGSWKAGSCATCAFECRNTPTGAFAGILADLSHTLVGQMTNSFSKSRMRAHFDHCAAAARPDGCHTTLQPLHDLAAAARPLRTPAGPTPARAGPAGLTLSGSDRPGRTGRRPPPGTPGARRARHAWRPVRPPPGGYASGSFASALRAEMRPNAAHSPRLPQPW